jgi:3-phosphoshikimate 1-carboxyvinyltransferase
MRNVGLNPGRVGMLDVLRRMRADVHVANERIEANEPVGDIRVTAAPVVGTDVAPDEVPAMIDEIPAIAALAARAAGETRITGARELRVKETDRIAALVTNLRAIGVDADELDDGLVVQGNTKPLKGDVRCHGDHRIAMAFGVLASLDGSDIRIDQPNVVDVSFPSFWRALHDVTGKELNT